MNPRIKDITEAAITPDFIVKQEYLMDIDR
jgi:hypothetical protein